MRPVLIVACSQRKTNRPGPAIQVYDGQLFRILRKYRPDVDLFVLSAKYGLIEATQEIEPYDQRLSSNAWQNQEWLHDHIAIKARSLVETKKMDQSRIFYVCAGDDYYNVIGAGWPRDIAPAWFNRIPGYPAPIGKMQAALRDLCLIMPLGPNAKPPKWVEVLE